MLRIDEHVFVYEYQMPKSEAQASLKLNIESHSLVSPHRKTCNSKRIWRPHFNTCFSGCKHYFARNLKLRRIPLIDSLKCSRFKFHFRVMVENLLVSINHYLSAVFK